MAQHYEYQINCTLIPDLVTNNTLSIIAELKKIQQTHKELKSIVPINNLTEMTAFLSLIDDKLRYYDSSKNVPLAYFIHPNHEPPLETIDARNDYEMVKMEIVTRAPHTRIVART